MFHYKLIELESELLAKEECARGFTELPLACSLMFELIEGEIGIRLADKVPRDWRGWLTYKRKGSDHTSRDRLGLIVCRGKGCSDGGLFSKWRAGLDVAYAVDTANEYGRGFDVTPPQELDHLLINFAGSPKWKAFLWYGENIAPYKLIYQAEITDETDDDVQEQLKEAVVEACTWILTRPKEQTLNDFLKSKSGPQ